MSKTWELPHGAHAFFPRSDADRLKDETGYFAWSKRMKSGFETIDIMDVVSGDTPRPDPSSASAEEVAVWRKKDRAANAMLLQCIDGELVVKVCEYETTMEALDHLEREYGQTGAGSIMHWFRQLTNRLERDSDLAAHIRTFQQAGTHLGKAGFVLPGPIASAIFLSTLPSDPDDPRSWHQHVKGVKIDSHTTLVSVIEDVLDAARRTGGGNQSEEQKQETALAALEHAARARGTKFCRNCKRDGHTIDSCWAPGGGKAGQGPKQKKRKGKGKGKEKAHHTTDGGGDEDSNNVRFEKCLMASEADFSSYSLRESIPATAPTSSSQTIDSAYSARTAATSTIIDSGTSTHIHSVRHDFVSYAQSASGNINGFGDGKESI